MGLRNPFRFAVNRRNDDVYLGDYSPDAHDGQPGSRPRRTGAVDGHPPGRQLRLAVLRDARPAIRRLGLRDRRRPVRRSTAPAGQRLARTTPGCGSCRRSIQPDVWYTYGRVRAVPGAGHRRHRPDGRTGVRLRRRTTAPRSGGRRTTTACRCSTSGPATTSRSSASTGRTATGSTRSGTSRSSVVVDNPMDMEFGPDGALYVLEYGDGFFSENPDAQLSRIDFVRGNHTPVPKVAATPTGGQAPLTVAFSSAGTTDADGDTLAYAWDFDADGTVDSTAAEPDAHLHGRTASTTPRCRSPTAPGARRRRTCGSSSATSSPWSGYVDHRPGDVPVR